MELVDLDHLVGLGDRAVEVAPIEDARPDDVGAGLLVEHRRIGALRLARIDEDVQRLVFDLDELGSVARELARGRDDRCDRLADEPRLAHREGVVLDVGAGRRRELEERVGEDRDLVARQRPVDVPELERLRDVDAEDLRVGVRRADEVDVAHPVPLDVVEEHALALHEPLVLLARDALALEGLGWCLDLRRLGSGRCAAHSDAALTASKMFQ